eukprot:XP_001609562.1 hypothetical protein [Babesia bovis T2Bo]
MANGDLTALKNQESVSIPAVILAAYGCDNLLPLTNEVPKALLKVGNKSLISGTVNNLLTAGIKKILVFANKHDQSSIQQHLREEFQTHDHINALNLDISIHVVDEYDGMIPSTSHVVKIAATMLNSHFIVVPCDLYGNFNFQGLIQDHLSTDRLCTIALIEEKLAASTGKKNKDQSDDQTSPGGDPVRGWGYKYKVLAMLDIDHSKVVSISNYLSLCSGEPTNISKWTFRNHNKCSIRCDLYDAHIYVFSKDIIHMLTEKCFKQSSLRLDVIPYIIAMQDVQQNWEPQSEIEAKNLTEELNAHPGTSLPNKGFIFQYPYVGDASQCCRVNSIETLMKVNMQQCFDKTKKNKTGTINSSGSKIRDVVFGEGCKLGDGTTIKSSVLGLFQLLQRIPPFRR